MSITDLQQTRTVHFVESEKHAKRTCSFSVARHMVYQRGQNHRYRYTGFLSIHRYKCVGAPIKFIGGVSDMGFTAHQHAEYAKIIGPICIKS